MAWKIKFEESAQEELENLDTPIRKRILRFLHDRIQPAENPRLFGAALQGSKLGNYWKYRVGDYRLICHIRDETITVTVVKIGHRRDVYR